ncbi:hypothetical protein ACFSHT_14700 [Paraburkholderia silviterrae]|uniref:Uncharacterized protein n=1 Tax=Paraburkholderia silviterrae TaxID=2528715 RepID=A0A4R5M217_9BURK|nr:hypothetical protein [Paraburkholderia silviterrae]TDG19474.1 hypothetical protein EYW47_29840 [Paraburkholderia silviterrae]
MSWSGIVVLGLAIGCAGWFFHPLRRGSGPAGRSLAFAVAAALAGAALAKAAGRATGLFYDGELLEWPVCTALAFVFVAVSVALRARR